MTTLCSPMDHSLPGSPVHGILQSRILRGLPCPSPGDLPDPGIGPVSLTSPAVASGFFTAITTWLTRAKNYYFCNYIFYQQLPPIRDKSRKHLFLHILISCHCLLFADLNSKLS